jgi:hypothetical protein
MYGYAEVGCRCHWCGAYVHGNAPKTGNHVFCRNKGKCKMAHVRAYRAYERRTHSVTPASGPRESAAAGEIRKSNKSKRRKG